MDEDDEIRDLMEIQPMAPEKKAHHDRHVAALREHHRKREEQIDRAWRAKNHKIITYTIVSALILLSGIWFANFSFTAAATATTPADVLDRLASFGETADYANAPADAVFLPQSEVEKLKQDAPAIYGDVDNGIWQAIFHGSTKDLVVLYDARTDKIVKTFELTRVRI